MLFRDIRDFYNKIRGKKVTFIGIGVSHEELIRRCALEGALVTLCDRRDAKDIPQAKELSELGVMLHTGEKYLSGRAFSSQVRWSFSLNCVPAKSMR